ncbi:MAG: type ISP restriction/modification enzyme [Leptolyngbyaceae cyanobacterium]
MPVLSLKPSHKPVRSYYAALDEYDRLGVTHETAVQTAFQDLLVSCGRQFEWTLVPQYSIKRPKRQPLRVDGALVDRFNLARAFWEAKDINDNLEKEVKKKFRVGYPKDNIIFQRPDRALLYQDGKLVMDADLTDKQQLVDVVRVFLEYRPPAIDQWKKAVEEFGDRVKDHATALLGLIHEQAKINKQFIDAFADFVQLCRQAINPNLSEPAVEEMLIQHLLTERIFHSVFNNPDFAQRNIIAVDIEKVISALTSKSFSRTHFLSSLDRFYGAIEEAIDWRVEKMRLSKDKTQLKYNDFLTLSGIPPEVFEYRLGNRSALNWVIDQYRIKTDKRSGITNDPNRLDDEQYIVRLIKKVITVSLETVQIVNGIPDLGLPTD